MMMTTHPEFDTSRRYNALKALYSFYDDFVSGFQSACVPGCSTCCTVNVTATSLEIAWLVECCAPELAGVTEAVDRPHYQPSVTANHMALCCMNMREPPAESSEHAEGRCPFADECGLCSVYDYRPFACRAMSSVSKCLDNGAADMHPFIFTVNLAFYQILEHLDATGFSGNMLDLLMHMDQPDGSAALVTNIPLPAFIVPPDEQVRFRSLARRIAAIELPDGSLMGDLLPDKVIA